MLQLPLSGIKKIEEIVRTSDDYVSLSQGSLKTGGIPQDIKNYVQKLLETDITDYYGSSWGLYELRETLASELSKKYDANLSIDNILPTHGCAGALTLLFQTLLEAGDEVVIPEPAYPAYSILAQTARANVRYVSCVNEDSFSLDVEKIKQATTAKTKIIVFSHPSNPLGMIAPKETLLEIIRWADSKGIYVIIDEAYREYVYEGTCVSGIELLKESEFVVSTNTFSKNMAMSGWRVGYVAASSKLIPALAGLQDALVNCLNNVAQHAAAYATKHPEFSKMFHEKVKAGRDYVCENLQPLVKKEIVSFEKPHGGFFLCMKTQHADATELCWKLLQEAKVGLIPGISFGPSGAPFMRLCFAREREVLQEGVGRILRYFE